MVTTTATTTTTATPTTVLVPDLIGQSRADALKGLKAAGLGVTVDIVPGPPPAGVVVAQQPLATEQLRKGETVRINVSDGTQGQTTTAASPTTTATTPTTTAAAAQPTTVQVPSLSGDVKAAAQQLADKGLLASIQYVPGDDPLGTVIAQSPPAGKTVSSNSHVTLSVASGPGQKELKTVPNVVGQRVNQAVQTLNAAGLRLILLKRTVSDKSQAGVIVEQTPQPGANAPKNAQVLVYMGAYNAGQLARWRYQPRASSSSFPSSATHCYEVAEFELVIAERVRGSRSLDSALSRPVWRRAALSPTSTPTPRASGLLVFRATCQRERGSNAST